ncbi:MAG TPA: succinate dehydrogenase, cytochrome b556 subunit [Novosphingobium sp.]|nr:succinate dehydrogenase, cytochrome b556 subunit [Novosphingobium sp.]
MASASPRGKARPISPHLQIWRWGPAMAASILHRVTGNGLAVAGLGVLVWWLGALASGPEAYAAFMAHATSWYGLVVLVGISWTYFGHIASGLRHYVLDTGAGFELDTNNRWSWITIIAGIALTAAFWAFVFLR